MKILFAGKGQHGKKWKDNASGLLSPAIQSFLKYRVYGMKETHNILLQLCFFFPIAVLVRADGRREIAERWTCALFLQFLLLFVKISKNQQAEWERRCLNWKSWVSVLHQCAAITPPASQQAPGQTSTTGENKVEIKDPFHVIAI